MRFASTAVLCSLALSFASCLSLNSFFFNPTRIPDGQDYTLAYADSVPAEQRVPEMQRTRLTLADAQGNAVYAVFAGRESDAATAAAPTVIYHHGNASNIDGYWARASLLWSLGANVIVYDYCGYGRTPGSAGEACIYAAARTVTDWVRAQGARFNRARIYHYGYSLGSGPATEMSANYGGSTGLVLEAPFTSVAGMTADGSLVVPRSFLMTNQFDNLSKVRRAAGNSTQGVMILHGDIDDFVQTKYGAALAAEVTRDTAAGPCAFVRVPGANHGDLPFIANGNFDNLYSNTVRNFLYQPPPPVH